MASSLILIGSGGCMREIVWQIQEYNAGCRKTVWEIEGYVDKNPPAYGSGAVVGKQEIPYLGDDDYLIECSDEVQAVICVGCSALRKKIAEKLLRNPYIHFPNIILSNTKICEDVKMGRGCIISLDARISTNVILGDFVFLNTGSMVCHDGRIGDYVTLSPDVKLAGAVSVGSGTELGMGTKVIQGVQIAENVVTGAGSVVIRNIENEGIFVGIPAHQI